MALLPFIGALHAESGNGCRNLADAVRPVATDGELGGWRPGRPGERRQRDCWRSRCSR